MDIDTMVESHFKKNRDIFGFESIAQLIEEVMDSMEYGGPPLLEAEDKFVRPGAQQRERGFRMPNIIPTEITVGQRPESEDRSVFEKWMQNLGISGGGGSSQVGAKLQAVSNFFDSPEAHLKDATIAKTLSYLMFLNQFVWMLKEFNASVAGFLWEPFLASMFGGDSRQVPTSEGNIADIEIITAGGKENISLKILNKAGTVKGSFTDLVGHFAKGGTEMKYVIVVKKQVGGEKVATPGGKEKKTAVTVVGVTFYEFSITPENFFKWIGGEKYEHQVELKPVTFTLNKGLESGVVKRGGSKTAKNPETGVEEPIPGKEDYIWIRSASAKGGVQVRWGRIGSPVKLPDGTTGVQVAAADLKKQAQQGLELDLQGYDPETGIIDPDQKLTANVAVFGDEGAAPKSEFAAVKAPPESEAESALIGRGKDTLQLWGGPDGLKKWMGIAASYKAKNDYAGFFKEVQKGAPGVSGSGDEGGGKQFHIKPAFYLGAANELGSLDISTEAVAEFFKLSAERIQGDLVDMFNSLGSLTDNIAEFFLTECGQAQCPNAAAGDAAIKSAAELAAATEKAVMGIKGGAIKE